MVKPIAKHALSPSSMLFHPQWLKLMQPLASTERPGDGLYCFQQAYSPTDPAMASKSQPQQQHYRLEFTVRSLEHAPG